MNGVKTGGIILVLTITNTEVLGWESAIRGMRNPMNSWDKSDSHMCNCDDCVMIMCGNEPAKECNDGEYGICIGKNDLKLMRSLAKAGTDHRKFMRMINVTMDITAPLYWWKEFDTYKVGTVANSCSTMHKITAKEFELDDFSHEHLTYIDLDNHCYAPYQLLKVIINTLNKCRELYLETKDKEMWWQIIQLLPTSYNQRRTVMLNYEVLSNIYRSRKDHKLDEWHTFCHWIESLPYSKELIVNEREDVK
jgi:hypothetical protein